MSWDPELLALAEQVIAANRRAGRCIATAESCTGGMVSAILTEIPGASDVIDRCFVTYSNAAKEEMLGVSEEILATLGAVSEATAWAMAQGALDRSRADVAVAITGIAGPGGGSERKPVGTVVFARAERSHSEMTQPERETVPTEAPVLADTHHFPSDLGRSEIRRQATLVALRLLLP